MTPAEAFAAATDPLRDAAGVTPGTGFGRRAGLRVDGRIFAMLVDDALVVKLPAERCAALVDAGAATLLEMRGRRMREWARVSNPPDPRAWGALATEALAFVRTTA